MMPSTHVASEIETLSTGWWWKPVRLDYRCRPFKQPLTLDTGLGLHRSGFSKIIGSLNKDCVANKTCCNMCI